MCSLGAIKKAVALTLISTFLLSPTPSGFAELASNTVDPSVNGQTVSPEQSNENPDNAAFLNSAPDESAKDSIESGSSISPASSTLAAQSAELAASNPSEESVQTLVRGLQAVLPATYTVAGNNGRLTISYTGVASKQATGTLSSLGVDMILTDQNKIKLNMNTLQIDFKSNPILRNYGDISILEDGINSLLETGLIGTPAIEATSYAIADEPNELYEVLSLSQITLKTASTTGKNLDETRNISFAANGLDYTASRKTNGFTTFLTASNASVRATMNSF